MLVVPCNPSPTAFVAATAAIEELKSVTHQGRLQRLCLMGIRGRAEAGVTTGRQRRSHAMLDAFPVLLPAGRAVFAVLCVCACLSAEPPEGLSLQIKSGNLEARGK